MLCRHVKRRESEIALIFFKAGSREIKISNMHAYVLNYMLLMFTIGHIVMLVSDNWLIKKIMFWIDNQNRNIRFL